MVIDKQSWKVGQLAKRTGVTVRTLHHYDQIGLLSPSRYSDAGHRLYTEVDIIRLQQVMSLKQLGFALDDIKDLMENPKFNPGELIHMQLMRLDAQIRIQEDLRSRLQALHELLMTRQRITAEQLLQIIGVMKMHENYFTQDQLTELKERGKVLGPDKIREVENEWPELIAKVRAELEKGTPPANPEVVQLAIRWNELVNLFTGGDQEITKAAERFHAENPDNPLQYGIDKQLYAYIRQAMSHM